MSTQLRPSLRSAVFAALSLAVALLVPAVRAATTPPPSRPPVAAKHPVEDRYFDATVRDDYQWMERWDPETRAWVEGENAYTRGVLDRLPMRPEILARANELTRNVTPRYFGLRQRGATIFALEDRPPSNQPMLVALRSLDDVGSERVLVNPNVIDPSGSTTIDFYEPSLDGTRVAVSLSKGGTESGDVHLYDVASGHELPDVLPRVNGGTAGGDVAWAADGQGLWYTRYPAKGERADADLDFYQQVWFHALGTPVTSDHYVMGKDFPKIAEISFDTSDDGHELLVEVRNGDGGEIGWWLRGPSGTFEPVAGYTDRIMAARFAPGGLELLSRRTSDNGSVLFVPFDKPALANAVERVPAGGAAIDDIHVAGDRLLVQDIDGGPSAMRVFGLDGTPHGTLPIPPLSTIGGFAPLAGGAFAIERESYTEPAQWLRFDPASGALRPTALAMKSPADFSDVEVRREFATSKDGTRVPISILMKKGTVLDGKAPLLLYGYGGYGLSEQPDFRPTRMLWIEQGGIYAVANIRGGREYGDAWHRAGMLTKKQNVFDDFAACAQHLVDAHFTTPSKLAIQGGSNGGLLMGAELTQHPDLFGAVVSSVGVYDMLRVELSPNGLFNTTEYGSVKDSAQFRALRAYSPYHNVRDGVQYPATLMLTGANDPRVEPSNSFKFAARLQASGTSKPVLLRTSMGTGHIGTPLAARNEETADIFSFLFSQLGLHYRSMHAVVP